MANPMQNPSAELEDILRNLTDAYPNPPVSAPHWIYLSSNPPPYLDATLENLQYIKHQQFVGIDDFATIQILKNRDDAYRHWRIQKSLDSKFFIQPQRCVQFQGPTSKTLYYVLIFDKIIREFRVWVRAHANNQVSDKDLWELLKKIGRNIRYLSTEIQTPRPHNNLLQGIGITADLQVFFFNLGAATNTCLKDVQEFDGILTSIEPNLVDLEIKERVNRWRSFFSTSCLAPNPTPIKSSRLYNPFNLDHVKLIFNYPSVWNDEDNLRFLANMHKLCTDICKKNRPSNLLDNQRFRNTFTIPYARWDSRVTATTSALNEVYQYGIAKGNYEKFDRKTHTRVLSEASIVTFAHNCVKHLCERAQNYNNQGGIQLPELSSSEILAEIRREFPYLIEDIYRAFHRALARGYKHHIYTVSQILTGRI